MSFILKGEPTYTEDIRKSRFTAIAKTVYNETEIKEFLEINSVIKATHNCWAWRIGEAYRFNDDGEPGGTAGRPILQAIDAQAVDNVVVLVIRWFGGIKLGTGGLARAYGGVANECLRLADKVKIVEQSHIKFFCPYNLIDLVQARLTAFGAVIEGADFDGAGVNWDIVVATSKLEAITALLIDVTNGKGQLL